jgi:hypothetical protein
MIHTLWFTNGDDALMGEVWMENDRYIGNAAKTISNEQNGSLHRLTCQTTEPIASREQTFILNDLQGLVKATFNQQESAA